MHPSSGSNKNSRNPVSLSVTKRLTKGMPFLRSSPPARRTPERRFTSQMIASLAFLALARRVKSAFLEIRLSEG